MRPLRRLATTAVLLVVTLATPACVRRQASAREGSVATPLASACERPFSLPRWGLTLCVEGAPEVHEGRGPLESWVLLGRRIAWPFTGGYRFTLRAAPLPSDPEAHFAALEARARAPSPLLSGNAPEEHLDGFARLEAGPRRGARYRRSTLTMQCPEVVYAVPGPRFLHLLTWPDCGATEEFRRESDAEASALLRTLRFP